MVQDTQSCGHCLLPIPTSHVLTLDMSEAAIVHQDEPHLYSALKSHELKLAQVDPAEWVMDCEVGAGVRFMKCSRTQLGMSSRNAAWLSTC